MATFKAIIDINGDGSYANDIVEISSKSTVGSLTEDTVIVGEGIDTSTIDISQYTVYDISKTQWELSDGKFYSDASISHKFASSGVYQIKLTIWSPPFLTNDGKTFYFTHSAYKDITIESKILKTFLQFNPTWELTKNDAAHDFFKASANFFEKIYRDTTGLFDLWDAERINPSFFEYLAITLGHSSDYSKKVGYDMTKHDFESYDIYDRIQKGAATKEEIQAFRRFLMLSSELFRKKGSKESIEKFLSLFTIDAKAIELWTKNWGETPVGETDENFIGFDIEDNAHGFVWKNIRVVGNCITEKGYIRKNLSSITVDNYHNIQKIEYPSAVVGNVLAGDKAGWEEIELEKDAPYVYDIRTEDGNLLVDEEIYQVETDAYDIVKNDPPRDDERNRGVLQIKPETVEIGDRIIVAYYGTEDTIFDSILATKEKKSKDFDIRAKFILKGVVDPNKFESFKYPENEVFVLFRGVQSNVDLYATFDEYYKVSVNGSRGTASLVKVINDDGGKVVYQKLNVSGDRNTPVFDIQIIKSEDPSCPTEMKLDTYYELKVSVVGQMVSAYLIENDIETVIQNNIDSDSGGNPYGVKTCKDPIPLFENISLDQDSAQIVTHDADGNDVIDRKYTVIDSAGHYGFGIRASIVELKDYYINNLDADTTLYTTTDKEFNLMPKYLEYKKTKLLRYDNYSDNNDAFYNKNVIKQFNVSTNSYDVDTKSLSFLYADNVKTTEETATRYTVTFDDEWLKSNFNDVSETVSKIIIPFGNQRMWFVPESRAYDKEVYRNYYGGYDLKKNGNIIPGLFRYNSSTVLDTYDLEPGDSFSDVVRDGNTLNFTASNRLIQYTFSKKPFGFRGMFQEVCPHSAYFDSLDQTITLPDNTDYKNPVFQPITVETPSGVRVIGVRFKNCDDIERLMKANESPIYKSVQLYGLFSMNVSAESIRYCPDKTSFTRHPSLENTYIVKFFVPLGVLNKNRRTYSLNSEFLKVEDNTGNDNVRIEAVFVRNPKDQIKYDEINNTFKLADILKNPYEDYVNNLYCKFYVSGEVKLSSGLQSFDYGNEFPNTFVIGNDVRNLLTGIENGLRATKTCETREVTYSYEDDYRWWLPKSVWRKRDIKRQSVSYSYDILSGINYKKNQFDKFFYNFKIDAGYEKPKALSFKITDGNINKETVYYAKVKVKYDYSGFSYSEISKVGETNNPLDTSELSNISVGEGVRKTYTDFRRSPVSTCLTFYIPVSWYPTVPTDNTIEWFNYIVGSAGTAEDAPSISITPIGLMTYLINNAGDANKPVDGADQLISVTRDWTLEQWNELFDTNVDIEFVAEEIPKDKYKLFDKYAMIPNYPVNVGTEIKIEYNVADTSSLGWSVFDSHTMYAKSDKQKIFDLPSQLKSMRRWAEDVHIITINKLIIPPSNYEVLSDTKIKFISSDLMTSINGGDIIGRYYFDVILSDDMVIKKEDDFLFNKKRTINLLPYQTIDGAYASALRSPNTDLVFNSLDTVYNIENIDGEYVFKALFDNQYPQPDYRKSGKVSLSDNEVSFYKGSQNINPKLYIIDDLNGIFDMTANVKFDQSIKTSDGKKFEFIIKADTVYDSVRGKNILNSYYFVGIGVYNFDIGLGVAKFNQNTGKMEKSFLAGFGDYNMRGVNTGKWYSLRTIVTDDYIRVMFNEKDDASRLVINYNISRKTQTSTSRYIDGSFDELVYLVAGKDKLDITYPDKLGEKTSASFVSNNFNDMLVKSTRPVGSMTGFVFYNDKTYLDSIEYIVRKTGDFVYGDTHTVTDDTMDMTKIFNIAGSDTIEYINKTTNNTTVILSNGHLLYKLDGGEVTLYSKDVRSVVVAGEYVLIRYGDMTKNVEMMDQNFTKPKSVYVKDSYFNVDHIFNYLKFTNRKVRNIWLGDDRIYIEFCDVGICLPWNDEDWNIPLWGCFGDDRVTCVEN